MARVRRGEHRSHRDVDGSLDGIIACWRCRYHERLRWHLRIRDWWHRYRAGSAGVALPGPTAESMFEFAEKTFPLSFFFGHGDESVFYSHLRESRGGTSSVVVDARAVGHDAE